MTSRDAASPRASSTSYFDENFLKRADATLLGTTSDRSRYRLVDPLTKERWRAETARWKAEKACLAFETAFRVGARADPAFVVAPLALIRTQDGPVVVFEDADEEGTSAGARDPISVDTFLDRAFKAAAALDHLHSRDVIHRDIRPDNIAVAADGTVRLDMLGRGIVLDRPLEVWPSLPVDDDALPYAAPEAARRTEPAADQRSDLYALGMTFYEWLLGRGPFQAQTPAEWLHAHVAVEPPRVASAREIPAALDDIVAKLIAKDPAERYQSAALLKADLLRCQAEWSATRTISPFALEEGVRPKLVLPRRLFGREAETAILADALSRVVRTGRSEVVLIAGPAGAGKSALAYDLKGTESGQASTFAAGKSDQHERKTPFAAIVSALGSLVSRVLTSGSDEVHAVRARLLASLAGHGQLVTDLLPELELVIGRSAPVVDLPAGQARKRLNAALIRTFQAFALDGAPLILFLDDLQWADGSTWALVQTLVDQATQNILLIGAYRDNDKGRASEIRALRASRVGNGPPVVEVALRPLTTADIVDLVAAAVGGDLADVKDLAKALREKTAGNPFYVSQLIRTLVDEEIFRYDPQRRAWRWDLNEVSRTHASDNVVDFLVRRLDRLSPESREILRYLACIGPRCDEALLARVLDTAPEDVRARAQPAKDAGLLSRDPTSYAFSHDRVLEAAYALSGTEERAAMHGRIAAAMVELWGEGARDGVFAIASQIERTAADDVSEASKPVFVAALVTAARRAKAAAAVTQASSHLGTARRILGPDQWSRHHAAAFEVVLLECECLILQADLDGATRTIDALLERALSNVDRAAAYRLRAEVQTLRSDYEGAIAAMLEGLGTLGIELRRHPTPEQTAQAYGAVKSALSRRPLKLLGSRAVARDPEVEAAMGLLVTCQASFFVNDGISFLHLAKIVELTLEHGPTPASAYGLSWFGVYVAHHFGDYRDGFAYAQTALELVDRHGWDTGRTATLVALDQVSAWTQPMEFALARAREAAAAGASTGDPGMSCYAWNHIVSDVLFMGEQLRRVLEDANRGLAVAQQIGFRDIERLIGAQIGFVECVQNGVAHLRREIHDDFSELGSPSVSQPTLFWEWLYAGMGAFLFGDVERAARNLGAAGHLTWALPAHINLSDYHLFAALVAARAERPADAAPAQLDLVPHRDRLAVWADLNPPTFRNKLLLVEAEMARLDGEALRAMRLYEQSASAAAASGFIHEQAIAHELAAQHSEANDLSISARHHLRAALDCYRRWGATGKVRDLEGRHPFLSEPEPEVAAPKDQAALDMAAWVDAARAFSEELLLDRLIEKLMAGMIVHAGARYGVLLLMRDDAPVVEATARVVEREIAVKIGSRGLAETKISTSVLNAVIRTRKSVVIDGTEPEASVRLAAGSSACSISKTISRRRCSRRAGPRCWNCSRRKRRTRWRRPDSTRNW